MKKWIFKRFALFLAIGGAGLAVEIAYDAILALLPCAQKSHIGMGGSPDADDARAYQRCEVHICAIHAEHKTQAAYSLKVCP